MLIKVAQRVEHQTRHLTDTGSTPVKRSKLAVNQRKLGAQAPTTEAGGQRLFVLVGRIRESRWIRDADPSYGMGWAPSQTDQADGPTHEYAL